MLNSWRRCGRSKLDGNSLAGDCNGGKESGDIPPGTLNNALKQAGLKKLE